jgi:Holliday junction resolvase RusA-like endonuclease
MAIRKFDFHKIGWVVEFNTVGEPASKANSRRLVAIGGKPRFIKSKKGLLFVQSFITQCPTLDPLLDGDLLVAIEIYYASRRPDLDESLILDAMENKVYKNDRQVKEKHIFWNLDRDNPRIEIKIAKLNLFS